MTWSANVRSECVNGHRTIAYSFELRMRVLIQWNLSRKMADDGAEEATSNVFKSFMLELFTSPLNLSLLAVCGYLLYKIFSTKKPDSPVKSPQLPALKKRDFTLEQLKEYDGRGKEGRILMAVNGKVFDVTRGKRFYGPGNS